MRMVYILKMLWRHRTRTLLTVSGTAVAIFVFCAVGSVQEGLHRLTEGADAQRRLIVFQENRFCPTSSRLPHDYAARIREVRGVAEVIPMQVWTNNCRASLDIVVFNGVETEQLQRHRPVRLVSGSWEGLHDRHDAAIVGQNVARRRNLSVGDPFSIGEISVHVAGVFTSPVAAEENLIYTDLAFLQYTQGLDAAGLVTQHEVLLDDSANPDEVAATIDQVLRSGPVPTKTRRKGAFQTSTLSDLTDLIGFAHWLGFACVGLVLSLVATTTVMSVQDRIKEYAVLQTLGFRPWATGRLVIAESTLMCCIGGTIGTALALAVLGYGGYAVGAEGATIAFRPSWSLFVKGEWVSLLVGVAAGILPSIQVAGLKLVAVLQGST